MRMTRGLVGLLLLLLPTVTQAYTYDQCLVNGNGQIEVWAQDQIYCNTQADCEASIAGNPNYCPVYENPGCASGTYWIRNEPLDIYPWTVQLTVMQPGVAHTPTTFCLGHQMYDPSYTYRCTYFCGFIQPLVDILSPGSTVKAGKQVLVSAHVQDELQILSLSLRVMNSTGTVIMTCSNSGQYDLSCAWNVPTGRNKTYTVQASATNAGGVSDNVTKTVTSQ